MKANSYSNLAFKGGGVRGAAYIGALEVLDSSEVNILKDITRVSGSSAGAITAFLLSFGIDAQEFRQEVDKLDFNKIMQKRNNPIRKQHFLAKLKEKLFGRFISDGECLIRLFHEFGWYSTDYFYNWLLEKTAKYCGGNANATFADFKKQEGFRDLYLAVSNISDRSVLICSAETTPDLEVAKAVRMSMSIPIFFESIEYNNSWYADGGVLENYPIHVFDDAKYTKNTSAFDEEIGINNETLGCYLFEDPDLSAPNDAIVNLPDYVISFFMTMKKAQDVDFEDNVVDRARSVLISDMGVNPIDFNIKTGDEKYNKLVESGRAAAKSYFNINQNPA